MTYKRTSFKKRFTFKKKIIFNYVLPNLFARHKCKIEFKNYPQFNQKTLFTGEGSIIFGTNCMLGYKLGGAFYNSRIEIQARFSKSKIIIEDRVQINNNLFICSANSILIKKETKIGQGVCIMDFEAHGVQPDKRNQLGEVGKVIIGENVWVGNNVTILKNTTIGDNTIIAAGAVVSGEIPDNVIVGGVPAKIIKNL